MDNVLHGNFNNRTSYHKDQDNGSLARHRRACKEGQGDGGGEHADMDEDEFAMVVYDKANLGLEAYDHRMVRGVPGGKRVKIIGAYFRQLHLPRILSPP